MATKKPKVKSVGTVDFNVNTTRGKAAYDKARKASKGLKTDKAKDAATTEALHGDYNRGVKAGKEHQKDQKKTDAKSDGEGYKKAGAVADAIGSMASDMSKASTDSFRGLNPSATKVRGGKGSTYNYQPKSMSDSPGDTSPVVRYDSDYEKRKKSMGL